MRVGTNSRGYTIVEVMVFLAVSGVMFIVAAGFINGKQANSEFRQGMNDVNSKIQQEINDVSNGFYPSNGDFACQASASGDVTFGGPVKATGTNKGCTFMGKVMQFGLNGTDSQGYNIYTIVGRQFQTDDSTLLPPTNFNEERPVAVTGSGLSAGSQNLTERQDLKWGVRIDQIYNGDASHPIGAVGIFAGFASNQSGDLDSGAATPIAIAIPNSQLGQSSNAIDSWVSNLATASLVLDTNPDITMCFRGSGGQYGRLNIGTSDNVKGQRLATHIQISNKQPTGICPA
jgi:hypothetical protein